MTTVEFSRLWCSERWRQSQLSSSLMGASTPLKSLFAKQSKQSYWIESDSSIAAADVPLVTMSAPVAATRKITTSLYGYTTYLSGKRLPRCWAVEWRRSRRGLFDGGINHCLIAAAPLSLYCRRLKMPTKRRRREKWPDWFTGGVLPTRPVITLHDIRPRVRPRLIPSPLPPGTNMRAPNRRFPPKIEVDDRFMQWNFLLRAFRN